MTQSTLQVTYDALRREIGRYMGWGRDPSTWTADQATDAADILASGLRRFYWPVDDAGNKIDHEWSFLKATGTLVTTDNIADYDLPDDFGDIAGRIYYGQSTWYSSIEIVTVGMLLESRQRAVGTGKPHQAAFESPRHHGIIGQRWRLLLYPTPDSGLTLKFRYNVLPDALVDATKEHPYGGAQFAEAIIESCLAAAELKLNDEPGVHSQEFRRQLSASVQRDGRGNVAESFGYNGDNSESRDGMSRRRYLQPVTYSNYTNS